MSSMNEGGAAAATDDLDIFEAEATGQPATSHKGETVPDKYSGKTVDDLIKMHQNAERLISRQGQEVAQVRRMADEILSLKKPTTAEPETKRVPVTVDALLQDPELALKSAVDGSDAARRAANAEQRVANLEAKLTQTEFVKNHPTFTEDLNDPSFLSWVNKNPVRSALGAAAASNNFEAASNLWAMWEEHKEIVGSVADKTTQKDKPKANVPRTVKSAPADTRTQTKYSRAKLMELRYKVADGDPAAVARWNDPTFQANLIKAYDEGRVV